MARTARRSQHDAWELTIEFMPFVSIADREKAYESWCASVQEAMTNAMPPLVSEGRNEKRSIGLDGANNKRPANVGRLRKQRIFRCKENQ